VARRLLGLLVISAFAVSCGGGQPKGDRAVTSTTPHAVSNADGRPGELAEIGDGRSLFWHCVGSGSPTVVLEAGLGADTSSWRDVQPQLGRITRTCAYDRAGTGNSVAPPGVRDARDEIDDLRRLLAAHAKPPYVLVGHSYGGVLARVFAHLRRTETAGLVLIDTMGRDGRRRQLAIWPEAQALWNTMQDELAGLSDSSVHVVALPSNHDVPSSNSGQPSVVVRAVQAVVRAARDHTRVPPCPRLFSGSDVRCRS
jgi:pimeloyl-ACP methyl ester carboxylesterase